MLVRTLGTSVLFLMLGAPVRGAMQGAEPAERSTPDDIRIGHWLVAKGRFDGDVLVASHAELVERGKYELLIGTVPAHETNPDEFHLLGQPVSISERTEWKDDLAPGRVAGLRVGVEGRWRGPGKLSSREIERRGPGRERIGGRVDSVRRIAGGVEVRVMRYTIVLADKLEVEHDVPLSQLQLAPEREITAFEDEERGGDEDDLFGEGIALSSELRLESQLEWDSLLEDDFNLDADDAEDRIDHTASFRSRLVWTPSSSVTGIAELRYRFRAREDQDDGRSSGGDAELGEAFLLWRDAFGSRDFDVAVGRQDFDEPREWIYDQNLDALRVIWRTAGARLELSNSTTLADGDRVDRESKNWIAYLSNADRKRHAAVWSALREDFASSGDHNLHVGARAVGDWLPDASVWLDVAHLSGERAGADVDAWGYDAGITWTPLGSHALSLTAGYALGSGDDTPGSGDDTTFRQTGFHDNNAAFDGVTSFRYYGELVDPELSNLGVLTLGVGTRLADRTSLDLVYHRYLQDQAAPALANSDLGASPSGTDADIGQELDLILGARESRLWDLEAIAAYFDSGDAFPGADDAFLLKLQIRLRL